MLCMFCRGTTAAEHAQATSPWTLACHPAQRWKTADVPPLEVRSILFSMTESPVLEVTTVISGCPVFTIRFSVLFITNHALRSASSCCGHLAIVEKVNNQEENTFLGSTSEIRSEKPAKRVLSKIPDFLFGGSCGRKLQNSGSSRISPFLPVDTSRIRQRERHFYTNNHVTQNTGIQVIAIPFIFETEIGVINTRRPSVRHDTVS